MAEATAVRSLLAGRTCLRNRLLAHFGGAPLADGDKPAFENGTRCCSGCTISVQQCDYTPQARMLLEALHFADTEIGGSWTLGLIAALVSGTKSKKIIEHLQGRPVGDFPHYGSGSDRNLLWWVALFNAMCDQGTGTVSERQVAMPLHGVVIYHSVQPGALQRQTIDVVTSDDMHRHAECDVPGVKNTPSKPAFYQACRGAEHSTQHPPVRRRMAFEGPTSPDDQNDTDDDGGAESPMSPDNQNDTDDDGGGTTAVASRKKRRINDVDHDAQGGWGGAAPVAKKQKLQVYDDVDKNMKYAGSGNWTDAEFAAKREAKQRMLNVRAAREKQQASSLLSLVTTQDACVQNWANRRGADAVVARWAGQRGQILAYVDDGMAGGLRNAAVQAVLDHAEGVGEAHQQLFGSGRWLRRTLP